MKQHAFRLLLAGLLGTFAVAASAASVDGATALAVARAFITSDNIGCTLLSGRSADSAVQRGRLWIVLLAPSGHVVVAGSDRADPIVGFSKDNFSEPDPTSPAFALLEKTSEAMDALDANATAPRHARWDALLGGDQHRGGVRDVSPPASTVVVEPFLASHWNQWQPYNDYTPVYDSTGVGASGQAPYRGRDPCGCVATAAAQVFRHFRWPAFLGASRTVSHSWFDRDSNGEPFVIRFDGRAPLDWNSLEDDYPAYSGGYDLRGKEAESVRSPIARLVLWCDSLARMSFAEGGSSADYATVAGNIADKYFPGTWLNSDTNLSAAVESFQNGIPCPVRLAGHLVVGHGWASDGSTQYIYLNYGWGGSNDGWYNIPGAAAGRAIQSVLAGHFPRAKPQLDPLPAVTESGVTLSWHFPDFHTNALTGFFVHLTTVSDHCENAEETFSDFAGTIAGSDVAVVEDATYGYDGLCLSMAPGSSSSCTLSQTFVLSSATVVKFKVRSFYAQGSSLKLLARFDGGSWEPVAAPALPDTGLTGWKNVSVYLGDHGGQSAQLRIENEFQGGTYYPSGWIFVDDIHVMKVFPMRESFHFTPDAGDRSLAIRNGLLSNGTRYFATVTPFLSNAALASAESSDPITWTVAGTASVPLPGELSYEQATLSYSSSAVGDIWSVNGTQVDSTSVRDARSASIDAALPGALTESSVLTFSWTATGYYTGSYGTGSDAFTVVFTDETGASTTLWTLSNSADKTSSQTVTVPLGAYAGQTGSIAVRYSHSGPQYTSGSYGGTIIAPTITDVMRGVIPPVAYETQTKTGLGMPEILAVETAHGTDMQEGFYRECSRGGTVLYVTCSPSVTALRALPSHLSLVPDSAVTVHTLGSGEFAVEIDGSGVSADIDRTRMILTLEATDANGTMVCKDLSLRFSSASGTANEDSWSVDVNGNHVADGTPWTAALPYSWLVKNGLASKGSSSAAFASAALADADGDGLANWGEWICGTSPTNATETLRALISMDGDQPVLDYAPHTLRDGFTPAYIGTENLSPPVWEPVNLLRHRFFRVMVEPSDE